MLRKQEVYGGLSHGETLAPRKECAFLREGCGLEFSRTGLGEFLLRRPLPESHNWVSALSLNVATWHENIGMDIKEFHELSGGLGMETTLLSAR